MISPVVKYSLIAALIFGAGWWIRATIADSDEAKLIAAHSQEKESWATAATKAVEEARTEERRRTDVVEKELKNANNSAEIANIDAASANDLSARLRKERDTLLANAKRNASSATKRGKTESDLAAVFADLFSRADKRAGELAEYADRARNAGLVCERIYDGVRNNQ